MRRHLGPGVTRLEEVRAGENDKLAELDPRSMASSPTAAADGLASILGLFDSSESVMEVTAGLG